jgi:hypothetical protein
MDKSALTLNIFISYSRKDLVFVTQVQNYITQLGTSPYCAKTLVKVWFDQRSISPGKLWMDELLNGLGNTDLVICFVSPDSMKSDYVAKEIEVARERKKSILPILYRPVNKARLKEEPRQLYEFLSRIQWLDFVGIKSINESCSALTQLDNSLENAWTTLVSALDLDQEQTIICALFKARHRWAVNYMVARVQNLMKQEPPDSIRAQYYVHALKSMDENEATEALNDLRDWWQNEINEAHTYLLEYAVGNPVQPC